jgi:hypothetical protein
MGLASRASHFAGKELEGGCILSSDVLGRAQASGNRGGVGMPRRTL